MHLTSPSPGSENGEPDLRVNYPCLLAAFGGGSRERSSLLITKDRWSFERLLGDGELACES